jgi:integrase
MIEPARVYEFPDRSNRPGSFVEYLTSVGLSRQTIRDYSYRVRTAERILDEMGADLLTANAFELAVMADMTTKTHSMRGQLRCALKHFYMWQDRMDAPIRAVRVPPQPRMVNKALQPEQAQALLSTARGWWPQGGVVILGLFLALRRAEMAAAEWGRFDAAMEWYTVTGKRDKTATIPVHPLVREELGPRRTAGYLFPGRKNVRDHVSPSTVWGWVKKVAVAAGVGEMTTHQLRHTSLTTALDNTENLRAVMEFARHERPDVTAGYTRTTKEQLRRVSEALAFDGEIR